MPSWLRKRLPDIKLTEGLNRYLKENLIETVCLNSRCPNISECYAEGNVSFLILGNTCTRKCLFCAIKKGRPGKVRAEEPAGIARTVQKLGLKYVVITSVTRDDIADGGAGHYAETVKSVKYASPDTDIEALVPDFMGSRGSVRKVIESGADVLSHNMEMPAGLFRHIRPGFDYERSLGILRYAASTGKTVVKSGFMLGLGETMPEIEKLMNDIRSTGCELLTIGQYLRPKGGPLEVREYIRPDVFIELKEKALTLGFKRVASGPFVRSSYRAGELFR